MIIHLIRSVARFVLREELATIRRMYDAAWRMRDEMALQLDVAILERAAAVRDRDAWRGTADECVAKMKEAEAERDRALCVALGMEAT